MRILTPALLLGATLLTTGCTTNVARFQMPGTDLDAVQTLYIEMAEDERNASELRSLIVQNLETRGYSVETKEPEADLQEGDYLFNIAADWHWDITWYLLELRVAIYEPNDNVLIAQAQSQQSSLARKNVETIVDRVMASLFNDPVDPDRGD